MYENFIGQPLKPVPGSFLTEGMASGTPSLPQEFICQKEQFRIASILSEWRESGPCRNGSSEKYLRKHWFRVKTTDNRDLKLYFERQPRGKQARWHLYCSIEE